MSEFADDWITKGYTKVNGEWFEVGGIPQVTCDPPEIPPMLGLHDVVAKLNMLETLISVDDAGKLTLAQNAYEGYCRRTGWKSLATGQNLPDWKDVRPEIRDAWVGAVSNLFVTGGDGREYFIRSPMIPA